MASKNKWGVPDSAVVTVQVGRIKQDFVFVKTDAPQAYDGMGTFTIRQFKRDRFIAVQLEHYNWQMGRNASGMNASELLSEKHFVRQLEDDLWDRLTTFSDSEKVGA